MDGFDRLPDCLIIAVFNSVADVKTLVRCRSVSRRFNSLVPQTDSLFLKIDRVVSSNSDSLLLDFLKSIFKSLHGFVPHRIRPLAATSPGEILRRFERIRRLKLEIPGGEIRFDGGAVVKWKAEFGKSLKKSVILGFNAIGNSPPAREVPGDEVEFGKRLKTRVLWAVHALMAASARHKLLREVAAEHGELEWIEMEDNHEEGKIIMERKGIEECRNCRNQKIKEETKKLTRVKMKMREIGWVGLRGGAWVQGGTLIVVGPTSDVERARVGKDDVAEEDDDDDEVALGAFDGVDREIVEALVKKGERRVQSYVLEMKGFGLVED